MTKRTLGTGLVMALGLTFALGISSVHAASPACNLQDSLHKLFSAHKDGDVQLELQARKGLLIVAATCSEEEAQDALAMLDTLSVDDGVLQQAKNQLIERLKEEHSFIDAQKTRVGDVGLRGTRDLARSLKEWRMNTHLPQLATANNFSLWEKNQTLIDVADTRARQINQTLKNLKLSDRDEIKDAVGQARDRLEEARNFNAIARDSLGRLENPDITAKALRNSFNALSAAYSAFFKISEEVKKILPL